MAALPRQRPLAFHLQSSGLPVKVQNCDSRSSTFVQEFYALQAPPPQRPPGSRTVNQLLSLQVGIKVVEIWDISPPERRRTEPG